MKILIVGINTRHIVCSAARAGYAVYSLDYFGDVDLRRCASGWWTFEEPPEDLKGVIEALPVDFDAVILGPGFESEELPGYLVLNNPPDVVRRVSDKLYLARELDRLGVPHPAFYESPVEAKYPLMAKPRVGAGGYENRVVNNSEELGPAEDLLLQEYVEGMPASVSVVSTGEEAASIAVNEQLIGIPGLSRLPFAYCGNITPLKTEWGPVMRQIAEEVVLNLGLVGSNGVDFIISERGPVVIEVNPRFQGSIDTVELATGFNVFEAHLASFKGQLPNPVSPNRYACKALAYSDREFNVVRSPGFEGVVDVPPEGRLIKVDEPIATAVACGETRDDVVGHCMAVVERIRAESKGY